VRLVRWSVAVSALALAAVGTAYAFGRDERRFPHAKHTGLFPSCVGCHAGVTADDSARMFPEPASCAGCHNGAEVPRVAWNGPTRSPTNLKFSHSEHERVLPTSGSPVGCHACHAAVGVDSVIGSREFMQVAAAAPDRCIACHEPRASSHLAAESRCVTCHVPLVRAVALSDSAIARFPQPPDHATPDFIRAHGKTIGTGAATSCATCHARESCARCHPNVQRVAAAAQLAPDARVRRVVAKLSPEYPVPPDHRSFEWLEVHGARARAAITSCANCHAQASCKSCHLGSAARREIAQLPRPDSGGARGVRLETTPLQAGGTARHRVIAAVAGGDAPWVAGVDSAGNAVRRTRVHPPFFATSHDVTAATGRLTCEGCHARKFCADCHDGEGRRRFHALNFVQRHAADSYAREQSCSSCHNPQVFCKSCHQSLGMQSGGTERVAFHTAQPLWLLQHGAAARQGLESCAACHRQTDCLQCHSVLGRGVSPHGPGFDPAAMARRNRQVCFACHLSDPLR